MLNDAVRSCATCANMNNDDILPLDLDNFDFDMERWRNEELCGLTDKLDLLFFAFDSYDAAIVINAKKQVAAVRVRKGAELLGNLLGRSEAAFELDRDAFALLDEIAELLTLHRALLNDVMLQVRWNEPVRQHIRRTD